MAIKQNKVKTVDVRDLPIAIVKENTLIHAPSGEIDIIVLDTNNGCMIQHAA